ncbi:hypothetical protein D9611_007782 [Ephemerocybe angulata]|uniref:DUF6534 domain-containing protein n=1 Tax=Ephemerocybe angulata TaxID=980116 RepID=A0A8H5CGX9_9AGAR|nr:hypothetical protein D9611_007782 [Tulosesus angulatus]
MAAPPGLPLTMKFDNTLGSLLLGGMTAMGLWGVTCVQTYTYFTRPKKDRAFLQIMVAFLLALDTFDSALNIHILYHYMVSNYLNPVALMIPVWSVLIHVFLTALSNFIIRTMFAQRIYRLKEAYFLRLGLYLTIGYLAHMTWNADLPFPLQVTGTIITIKAFQLKTYLELDSLSNLMYITFAFGTGSDLSVALALCWLLRTSRTGFRKTDSMIKVLMLYTVNTGLIVALDAAAGMLTYIFMPNNFIFLGFYLLLSKLYLNSYLATLNARQDLREQMSDPVSIHLSDISNSSRRFDVESSPTNISEKSPHAARQIGVAVSIHTSIDKEHDALYGPGQTSTIGRQGQAL